MSVKTTLAAAAAGALLAIPVTASAVGATDSPEVGTPCGAEAEWMQEHWNDPAHWDDMQSFMEEHWDEMESYMGEHWDEMGSHMLSDDFDHGPGMMGGFGMHGSTAGGYGMWQGDES